MSEARVCKHCAVVELLKDVVPHIKRGKRYAEKSMDGGKAARFVDITIPKNVADKILEIDKHCKQSGLYGV